MVNLVKIGLLAVIAGLGGIGTLSCGQAKTAAGGGRFPVATSAANRPPSGGRSHTSSSGLIWSADFGSVGFDAWDALDGNTSTPALQHRYFSLVPDPAGGPGSVFKATVDQNAVDNGEDGQRALLELWPDSERRSNSLAVGMQGRERWFHARVYFPKDFVPAKKSDWNWVIEWHDWPNGPCCENLALTVDTDPARGRGQRLVLRSEGGGTPRYPVDLYSPAYPARNRTTHDDHIVGDRHLRRGHWYDVLLHVVWDYRPRYGLVQWWLDGKLVTSRHTSTLYYYRDSNSDIAGDQPGPGRTYLEVGYYRDSKLLNGAIDRSVMSVYQSDDRVGTTASSVR